MRTESPERIKEAVRKAYAEVARRVQGEVEEEDRASPSIFAGCCGPGQDRAAESAEEAGQAGCCGPGEEEVAAKEMRQAGCCGSGEAEVAVKEAGQAGCCGPSPSHAEGQGGAASLFYASTELSGLPESVTDASLGCGNPTAIAELQSGEVVLDLGSGGGIDCFLAARQVGPTGRVIGLDMTTDMIKLARRNARRMAVTNVEFRYGEMEEIPLPDASVDVILSNCVINLSPDKDAVFREAYRVLRPGGRVYVSDIVTTGPLPAHIRDQVDNWAACLGGALEESVYLDKIRTAGFEAVEVVSRRGGADLPADAEVQVAVVGEGGQLAEGAEVETLLAEAGTSSDEIGRLFASVNVRARKPSWAGSPGVSNGRS